MTAKIKKVSSLTKIDKNIVGKQDTTYFVKQNSVNFESYNTRFDDIFLSTNNIDKVEFCSNNVLIGENLDINKDLYDNGNSLIKNSIYASNINTPLLTSVNSYTSNLISNTTTYLSQYLNTTNTMVYTNDMMLNVKSGNNIIANNTIISCGVNRVRDVSDPVENLDALNLQYFNNNSFKMTGAVVTFLTKTEPQGWLRANGQVVSRTIYNNLWQFANTSGFISNTEIQKQPQQFGPGDGSSTFSLPNLNCCSVKARQNLIDVYLVCDTTGSMGDAISNVKTNINNIVNKLKLTLPNICFGVGNYKDFPSDSYCFQHQLSITANNTLISNAVNSWNASGGYDGSEGWFYALHEISSNTSIGFRDSSTKVILIIGDSPAHDPICEQYTGLSYKITESTVLNKLKSQNIKLFALNIATTAQKGLDGQPSNRDYICKNIGAPGQGSRLSHSTGGSLRNIDDTNDLYLSMISILNNISTQPEFLPSFIKT